MPPKTRKMTSTAATVDAVDTSNAIPDATNTASAAPSADILTGLGRAYASHNLFAVVNKPMFDGNKANFVAWQIRFQAHLIKLDLYEVLGAEEPDATDNKKVFVQLLGCIDDDSVIYVNSKCQWNGKAAYDLLGQRYLGDHNARLMTALNQFTAMKQEPSEAISKYVARWNQLRKLLNSFDLFTEKGQHVFGAFLVAGLSSKCDPLKIAIDGENIYPDWTELNRRILNFAVKFESGSSSGQAAGSVAGPGTAAATSQVMTVTTGNNTHPTVKKNTTRQQKNHSKFKKNYNSNRGCQKCFNRNHLTHECRSRAECKICKNRSHNTEDCRYKNKNGRGRGNNGRGNSGNNGSGNSGSGNSSRGNNDRGSYNNNYSTSTTGPQQRG